MFHFREIDSSTRGMIAHVIFQYDDTHRDYLESMYFETVSKARDFLFDKDNRVQLAMYGTFGAFYFMTPTSIEMVVPNRYFVKHRAKNGTYDWIELELEFYGKFPPKEIKDESR